MKEEDGANVTWELQLALGTGRQLEAATKMDNTVTVGWILVESSGSNFNEKKQ